MSPVFDKEKQMLTFSILVYNVLDVGGAANAIERKFAADLRGFFNDDDFIDLMAGWTLEWGPAVELGVNLRGRRQVAANTVFVAKNSNDEYVITIAGTNPQSKDNYEQDTDVGATVPWSG